MPRTRSWIDESLVVAVAESKYMAEVLKKLGLALANGNYRTVRKRITELGLNISHWMGKREIGSRTGGLSKKYEISDILVENSGYLNGASMKKRLLGEGLIKNECVICGQGSEWKGKSLVMVLDHINGVHNNNRIENLRMLCPNCNSQQNTFAGRNKKTVTIDDPRTNCSCGNKKGAYSQRCMSCAVKRRIPPKVARETWERPCIDVLKNQVEKDGYEATGRKYGVSGNAVRKWVNRSMV